MGQCRGGAGGELGARAHVLNAQHKQGFTQPSDNERLGITPRMVTRLKRLGGLTINR